MGIPVSYLKLSSRAGPSIQSNVRVWFALHNARTNSSGGTFAFLGFQTERTCRSLSDLDSPCRALVSLAELPTNVIAREEIAFVGHCVCRVNLGSLVLVVALPKTRAPFEMSLLHNMILEGTALLPNSMDNIGTMAKATSLVSALGVTNSPMILPQWNRILNNKPHGAASRRL